MTKRLTQYGMNKRIKKHKEALKQAEELGHTMGVWRFSKVYTNVSISYCSVCQREIVCGLQLESVIGRALKENCNDKNEYNINGINCDETTT